MTVTFPAGHGVQIRIDDHSAIHLAARTAQSLAAAYGMPGSLPDQAATVASELGSNLEKHARAGVLYLQPLAFDAGLEVLAADGGPGIADPQSCLADGFTTAGTLGAGLGAVKRIATEFHLRSEPGSGTYAVARLAHPGPHDRPWRGTGSLCLPADGEQDSGDACAVVDTDGTRTVLVVDGLGHGSLAAEAAGAAVRSFRQAPDAPLPELIAAMHRALRRTRGAAVSVLRTGAEHAEYCGIGNISALVCSYSGVAERLRSQPGVVGWNLPAPSVQRAALPPGSTAVVHSDGIDGRWSFSPGPFLLRLPPPLLAAALMFRHRRSRDDASVVAVRHTKAYA